MFLSSSSDTDAVVWMTLCNMVVDAIFCYIIPTGYVNRWTQERCCASKFVSVFAIFPPIWIQDAAKPSFWLLNQEDQDFTRNISLTNRLLINFSCDTCFSEFCERYIGFAYAKNDLMKSGKENPRQISPLSRV